jgi:hypothetical protein
MPIAPYNYATGGATVTPSSSPTSTPTTPGGSIAPYNYAANSAAVAPVAPNPVVKAVAPVANNILGGAETLGGDMWNSLTAKPADNTVGPLSMKGTPTVGDNISLAAVNTYANAWKDMQSRFSNAITVANSNPTRTQNFVAGGEVAVGALNLAFAPVSSFLNATSHIPVLGGLSTGLNNVFSAIGTGGSDAAEGAIAALPLSDQTKATLTPLAKEIGALTAQIVAGKAGEGAIDTVAEKTNTFLNTVHDQIAIKNPIKDSTGNTITPNPLTKLPVEGDTTPRPLAVTNESPAETAIPNSNQYQAPNELPVIQTGVTPKSSLPTIQIGDETATPKIPGLTYEPISQTAPQASAPAFDEAGTKAQVASSLNGETTPTPTEPTSDVSSTKPSEPTDTATPATDTKVGEQTTTKGGSDINKSLVKDGYPELSKDQMASYTKGSYKDSETIIKKIAADDPKSVIEMGKTGENIPEGVHPQIAYTEAVRLAKAEFAKTGDPTDRTELANSPLNTAASEHASGLGSRGYNSERDVAGENLRKAQESKGGSAKTKKTTALNAREAERTITVKAKKLLDYQKILDAVKTC